MVNIGETLSQKYGPLPGYAWVGVGAVFFVLIAKLRGGGSGSRGSDTGTGSTLAADQGLTDAAMQLGDDSSFGGDGGGGTGPSGPLDIGSQTIAPWSPALDPAPTHSPAPTPTPSGTHTSPAPAPVISPTPAPLYNPNQFIQPPGGWGPIINPPPPAPAPTPTGFHVGGNLDV